MLLNQSIVKVKDNSSMLKVKIMCLYKKKKVKFKDPFMAVVVETKRNTIKKGSIRNFMATNLSKKKSFFSGLYKSSDINACLLLKDKEKLELAATSFAGFVYSEMKNIKNQKMKILLKKCI